MKLTFLTLTITFFLYSCHTGIKKSEGTSTDKAGFISVIKGNWYESTYIDDIQKTKSPFRSQDNLAEIVEFNIDISQSVTDTIEVGGIGIHEAANFKIILTPGVAPNSFRTDITDDEGKKNFYDFGYIISSNDTTLVISHYDKNNKLLGQTAYKKAPKTAIDALQYMVNKTLFSGSYKALNRTGKEFLLRFEDDGKLTGLPDFKNYYVLTDFVAEPQNADDEVCFDIQTKNQVCYAFEIKGDTINLYNIKDGKVQSRYLPAQLEWQLTRQ